MSSELYGGLLEEIAAVLDIFENTNATEFSAETKKSLVQAINRFREDLGRARDAANTLQGSELSIEDQDNIIETLEKLKSQKRTLGKFASEMDKRTPAAVDDVNMEIDSTASTPAN